LGKSSILHLAERSDPQDAARLEGFALLHHLERDHVLADVDACLSWLGSQPGIERTAMIGFSAGGHLTYLAACRLPISRTAVLYGGWLPTTDIPMSQPTPTLDLTPGISGRLLFVVGEDDALIDTEQRNKIRSALEEDHIEQELASYPNTGHAFFWPDTPMFNQKARDDTWDRILSMLAD
jgi:carboxymethylenebutenolidase